MKTLTIRAKSDDVTEILLYDTVGEDFFGGVSAKWFAEQLKGIKAKTINLRINSPGGSVFDGFAMYESLNRHKARIEVDIDGLAASAASVVAMAGDEIRVAESAFVMIHEAFGGVLGTAGDMRHTADLLEKVNGQIVQAYAKRTKQTPEQLAAWMDEETWFTGAEAVDAGFADSLTENSRVAADLGRMAAYCKHMPDELKADKVAAWEETRKRKEWLQGLTMAQPLV